MSESRYHIGDSQDAAGGVVWDNERKRPATAVTARGFGRPELGGSTT